MLGHTGMWATHSQKHLSCSERSQDLCDQSESAWWESFLLCINFDAAWVYCDSVISHLLVFKLMNLLLIIFFNHVSLLAVQLFFLIQKSDFINFLFIIFVFYQWWSFCWYYHDKNVFKFSHMFFWSFFSCLISCIISKNWLV